MERRQVKTMQEMGNGRARDTFEALLPDNYRRPSENDSYALEQFIRSKYERKEFIVKEDKPEPRKKRQPKVVDNTTQPKVTQPKITSPPAQDLLSFDANQNSSNGFEFVSSPPIQSVATTPNFSGFQGSSNPQNFSGFQGAQSSNYDSESAFFSGDTQQAKPSKANIMQLYNAPSTISNNPLPASFTTPTNTPQVNNKPSGPNYNIALPGLGAPPQRQGSIGMGMNGGNGGIGGMNGGMNGGMGGMNGGMGGMPNPNYYPGGSGPTFVGYRQQQTPPNFVNTNGYVNANYQSQMMKFV